jgi:hypothetical protein
MNRDDLSVHLPQKVAMVLTWRANGGTFFIAIPRP